MNNSLRRVPALLLLLLLCGCGRGGEAAEIRYYRLASGQSANHLANQACERFCSLVEKESGGAIQIIPSFENELGTDASALEQCVYGGIDFVRTPLSAAAAYAPQLSALQLPYEYTSDEHLFRVLDGDVGADAMDSLEEQGLTAASLRRTSRSPDSTTCRACGSARRIPRRCSRSSRSGARWR